MFSHTKRSVSYCSFVPSSDFLFVVAVNGDSDGDDGDDMLVMIMLVVMVVANGDCDNNSSKNNYGCGSIFFLETAVLLCL